ncbi:MAG: hypothetical protein R3Y05_01240 [bacterium]
MIAKYKAGERVKYTKEEENLAFVLPVVGKIINSYYLTSINDFIYDIECENGSYHESVLEEEIMGVENENNGK